MKKAVALTAIVLILFLVEPMAQFEAVEANPYMFLRFTRIQVHSPQYQVYVSPDVDISFDYYVQNNLPQVDSFSYSLDGNANSTLASSKSSIPQINFTMYSVFKALTNLSNDNHKLIVYAYFSNKTVSPILNQTVVVDTTYIQPTLIVISPLNQTYSLNEVSIAYTINAKIISSSYTLDYSNYAIKWTDFTGNMTLTELSEGSHKLMLKLVVQPHSGVPYEHHNPTIYFTVGSNEGISTPTSTPYLPPNRNAPHLDPTFYLLPISITVALVVLAVVVYRKRRLASKPSFLQVGFYLY